MRWGSKNFPPGKPEAGTSMVTGQLSIVVSQVPDDRLVDRLWWEHRND